VQALHVLHPWIPRHPRLFLPANVPPPLCAGRRTRRHAQNTERRATGEHAIHKVVPCTVFACGGAAARLTAISRHQPLAGWWLAIPIDDEVWHTHVYAGHGRLNP
jgi:hypothetical protein